MHQIRVALRGKGVVLISIQISTSAIVGSATNLHLVYSIPNTQLGDTTSKYIEYIFSFYFCPCPRPCPYPRPRSYS